MAMLHWYEQLQKKDKVSLRALREWLDRCGWEVPVSHDLTEEDREALNSLCSFCHSVPPHDNPYFVKPCGHHNCPTCSIGPCPACGYRMSWAWPKVGRRHMISGSPFGG